MKVYICYDWIKYEGCSTPLMAFTDENKAKGWEAMDKSYHHYKELNLDPPNFDWLNHK